MFPRKEVRLFIFTMVVLALGIGVRTICVMRLNRYSPHWVRTSNAHVAQAASLPTMAVNPLHSDHVTSAPALQNNAISVISDTAVIKGAGGVTGFVAVNAVSTVPQNTQEEAGNSSTEANSAQPTSGSSAENTKALTPENTCINPDGSKRLDLNTASAAELDTLPGIGPSYAAAILQERTRRGQFTSIRQLLDVKGIGPARFAKLEPLVCVVVVPLAP